jgi:alkylation response protein AidB-like acyl-CoA dehydrogenase
MRSSVGRLSRVHSDGYGPAMASIVERARAIAEDVLFPAALGTDASDLLPASHLDLLAYEGFYGIAGPADAGGSDLDTPTTSAVVESLASGCLTTAFVWLQHRNPVRAVAASDTPGVRDEWLAALCRGERRAGIALAGNRPGPPILRATRTAEGDVILNGEAPWVSGWGRIDIVMVTARDGDSVVSVLADAIEDRTLHAERLHLVGANASGTVTLRFHDHVVPAGRVIGEESHGDVLARDATGLRLNGSLALGVVDRCCRLMGPSAFDEQLVAIRGSLDDATPATLPAARAAASELALRAAAALTVAHGSRSILVDQHPQRLAREAMFLLVFGSRPPIRAELSRMIAGT